MRTRQKEGWSYYIRESRSLSRRYSRWAAECRLQAQRSPAPEKSVCRDYARKNDERATRLTATSVYKARRAPAVHPRDVQEYLGGADPRDGGR